MVPELLIVLIVLPVLAVPIWAAVDAAGRPAVAFERAGTNKTLWIVLPLVGLVLCGGGGIVAAIIWFASFRGKVIAAAAGGNPVG